MHESDFHSFTVTQFSLSLLHCILYRTEMKQIVLRAISVRLVTSVQNKNKSALFLGLVLRTKKSLSLEFILSFGLTNR